MDRRNFLARIAGIFSAPFVAKKAKATTYKVAVDLPATAGPDFHGAAVIRIGPDFAPMMVERFNAQKETLAAWRERMDYLDNLARHDILRHRSISARRHI